MDFEDKSCPLIYRNEFETTDKGLLMYTKLHPCIGDTCALWLPTEERNVGTGDYYEYEGHCGLRRSSD